MEYCNNSVNNSANGIQPHAQDEQKPGCKVPGCGKTFTRQSDLKRHSEEQHNPDRISYLCGCCKDKQQAPSFKRMEKLLDHKIKFHGHVKGSTIRGCPESTCQAESSTRMLCFCTKEGLQYHMRQAHGNPAPVQLIQQHGPSLSEIMNCKYDKRWFKQVADLLTQLSLHRKCQTKSRPEIQRICRNYQVSNVPMKQNKRLVRNESKGSNIWENKMIRTKSSKFILLHNRPWTFMPAHASIFSTKLEPLRQSSWFPTFGLLTSLTSISVRGLVTLFYIG